MFTKYLISTHIFFFIFNINFKILIEILTLKRENIYNKYNYFTEYKR